MSAPHRTGAKRGSTLRASRRASLGGGQERRLPVGNCLNAIFLAASVCPRVREIPNSPHAQVCTSVGHHSLITRNVMGAAEPNHPVLFPPRRFDPCFHPPVISRTQQQLRFAVTEADGQRDSLEGS